MGDDCASPPTGHPSSFISSSSQHQSSSQPPFSPPWEMGLHCGIGCDAALTKKNSKIPKKINIILLYAPVSFLKIYFYMLCTLNCTKFGKTNIVVEYFSAFKINKSHCSSEFKFFLYFKIFFFFLS